MNPTRFQSALVAAERCDGIPESADIYGPLIGSWDIDVRRYVVDVSERRITAEAHFARVLEGRAVQDLWIMPCLDTRTPEVDRSCNMYGTTLRIWDPAIQGWRVTWFNPVTGRRDELVGRREGRDIVQVGTHADGTPIRWCFTEMTADSFRWTGEALRPDGKTWAVEGEFLARRRR